MKLLQRSTNRQQLLENTVNHFNSTNRATNNMGGCKYRNYKGRGCAIGRELSDKLAKELDGLPFASVNKPEVFNRLPKRLQRMGQEYLSDIQRLHDTSDYWNTDGLSRMGKARVDAICETYNLKNPLKN